MSRPKRGAPSQYVANPFVPGDLVRRKKEYLHSGNWIGGDKAFRIKDVGKGFLTYEHNRLNGDFYYGYFERAK